MHRAFCAIQPIEKQINPLASILIDSVFSLELPLICKWPATTRANREAINGKNAQLNFIRIVS
jgi:hypothetical protein